MFVVCLLPEFSADTETRHKGGTAEFNNTLFTAAMMNPTSLITVCMCARFIVGQGVCVCVCVCVYVLGHGCVCTSKVIVYCLQV